MPDVLTMVFALFGVIAVIALMFWAARFFQKKYGYGLGLAGKSIRIEESVAMSPDSRLIIAKVDGVRYLIGTGNVRLLSELDDLPEEELGTGGTGRTGGRKTMPIGEAFKTVLSQKLNIPKVEEKEDAGENRFGD
ncbi:MAG: flagellar biosynthetic protein FliO [Ruminococcus sp.]|jgi:flagellar biogenesis protein FliO|nr:flagellar biosynthetic protein FliO [Ruminococcus sp.]